MRAGCVHRTALPGLSFGFPTLSVLLHIPPPKAGAFDTSMLEHQPGVTSCTLEGIRCSFRTSSFIGLDWRGCVGRTSLREVMWVTQFQSHPTF